MAVVYQHRRLDTNKIFYIGIGKTKRRAYSKSKRNNYWFSIILKTEYSIEILYDNIDWDTACEKEIELIKKYGRKDIGTGILCNMTDGGEGGVNPNQTTRNMFRDKMIGNTYRRGSTHTEETRKKIKQNRQYQIFTDEHKKNISNGLMGRIVSSDTRKKIGEKNSISLKGRKLPKEVCEKMSLSRTGNKHWNYTITPDIKDYVIKHYQPYHRYFGARELAQKFGISEQSIHRILKKSKNT